MRFVVRGIVSVLAICSAQSAYAQCVSSSNPVDDGDFVSCTGTDTNGFNQDQIGEGNLDDIGLTVQSGAIVNNSDDTGIRTIELDDNAFIGNSGEITSQSSDAIEIDNDGEIINFGVINGGDEAIQVGNDASIINYGTILADDKGITTDGDPGEGENLSLINFGTIQTVDESIEATDGVVIQNFGIVSSDEDDAIQFGAGSIENFTDGQILSGGNDAIDIDSGSVNNQGLIRTTASGEAGIDVDAGPGNVVITNTGTIDGAYGILADVANTGSQIITNGGTISAFENDALFLGDGADSLDMLAGSNIIGNASFGAGDDDLIFSSLSLAFGADAIFDGGADVDTVTFADGLFASITAAIEGVDAFTFAYSDTAVDWAVSLTNWEFFDLGGGDIVTSAELADRLSPTPVPLPAGGLLLLSGLAFLGMRRRTA